MAGCSASTGPRPVEPPNQGVMSGGVKSTCTEMDTWCPFTDMAPSTPLTGRVLVVDDNADVLTAARLALSPHFEKVETLQNPNKLGQALGDLLPHVILLDMNFAPGERTGREGMDWLAGIRQ